MMLTGNAIRRLPSSLVIALGLWACGDASTEATSSAEQHLCPDGPCGPPPRDPKDDPPPPPTGYYPASGWSVFNASAMNTARGVQWWAYAWDGYRLNVKGYYPQDFGTGISVDAEPAHVFLTLNITSPTDWTAQSRLLLPTYTPSGQFYLSHQNANLRAFMNEDGVIQQIITQNFADCVGDVCSTHENFGIYQDDGAGAVLIYGTEDTARSSAAQAALGFLTDFSAAGGQLLPPGATFDVACNDEECSNSPIRKYLDRKAQFLASGGGEDPCGDGAIAMGVCGVSMILAGFFPVLIPAMGVICGAMLPLAVPCVREMLGGRSSNGACTINTGPTTVTGPDGTPAVIDTQIVDRQNCDI